MFPTRTVNSELGRSEAATLNSSCDPIAPTEFPTGWSAAHVPPAPGAFVRCYVEPAGGGYRWLVTSEDGYKPRLTPECLEDRIGHRPAIHRLQQSLLIAKQGIGRFGGPPSLTLVGPTSASCPSKSYRPAGSESHWQDGPILEGAQVGYREQFRAGARRGATLYGDRFTGRTALQPAASGHGITEVAYTRPPPDQLTTAQHPSRQLPGHGITEVAYAPSTSTGAPGATAGLYARRRTTRLSCN